MFKIQLMHCCDSTGNMAAIQMLPSPLQTKSAPTLKTNNKMKKKRIKSPKDGRPPRPSEPSAAPSVPLDTFALNPGGSERDPTFEFFSSKKVEIGHYLHWLSRAAQKLNGRDRRCVATPSRACLLSPLTLIHACAHVKHLLPFFFKFQSPQQLLESNINQNILAPNFLHPPARCSAQRPLVAGAQ